MYGTMRYEATIEAPPTAQNSVGQVTGSWSTQETRRVSLEPLRGREQFELQQLHGTVDHRIVMHRYQGLKPQWRIAVGSRYFLIRAAMHIDDLENVTEVLAQEVVE